MKAKNRNKALATKKYYLLFINKVLKALTIKTSQDLNFLYLQVLIDLLWKKLL